MEPACGQFDREGLRAVSRATRPRAKSLKENQSDQENDYNPGNDIRHNQAIPQLAAGKPGRFRRASIRISSNRRRLRPGDSRDRRAAGFRRFLRPSKCGGHKNACDALKRLFAHKQIRNVF